MQFVNFLPEVKNSSVMLDIQASVYKELPLPYLSEAIILKSPDKCAHGSRTLLFICSFYREIENYKTLFVEEELKF